MGEKIRKVIKIIIHFILLAAVNLVIFFFINKLATEILKWITTLSILIIFTYLAKKTRDCINYITGDDISDSNFSGKENIISCDIIKPKKMYYNQRETEAINTLSSLLSAENYKRVIGRLDSKGMRNGFACLFSGGPGTGKTETAYQIAKKTNRNIMMVNISQTKSCWHGESEKKIKELFDEYRNLVEKSELTPIMLFNEADAVISKRGGISDRNRAIDESNNRVQNIILQEMENLTGIMIATTNLSQNMDNAFERRFLYRIDFNKPSVEIRKEIWKTLMPEIPEELCQELSEKYELTGGQIENIARKVEINMILNNDVLQMATLLQYCKEESQSSIETSRVIGFGSG